MNNATSVNQQPGNTLMLNSYFAGYACGLEPANNVTGELDEEFLTGYDAGMRALMDVHSYDPSAETEESHDVFHHIVSQSRFDTDALDKVIFEHFPMGVRMADYEIKSL